MTKIRAWREWVILDRDDKFLGARFFTNNFQDACLFRTEERANVVCARLNANEGGGHHVGQYEVSVKFE